MPSDFTCDWCVRPTLSKRTPKADENGVPLSLSKVTELYNERRYQHYLDDFNDELDLARHLSDRVRHFAETGSEDDQAAIKASGFASNAATLAWWKRARLRDPDAAAVAQRSEYLPTPAEIEEWAKLPPAARFARLKKQINETFDGRHDVPRITTADNAQQLPPEVELRPEQIAALEAAKQEQLDKIKTWGAA